MKQPDTSPQTTPNRFDVWSVDIETGKCELLMAGNKDARNAEAVVSMAVMRRGCETHFYATVPHGSHKSGDSLKEEQAL